MPAHPHARRALALSLAMGVLLGCGDHPTRADPATDPAPTLKRGGNGGGSGGGGETAGFTMTLAGAMAGGPNDAQIDRESSRGLVASSVMTPLAVAFSNTLGTDAQLATNCAFEATNGAVIPADVRARLVANLRSSLHDRSVAPGTDKQEGIGRIVLHPIDGEADPDALLIQFGGNAGDPPPVVEDVNGNLAQLSSEWTEPVVLRYTGGRVRTIDRIARAKGNGTDAAFLTCLNQDEITVTIERTGP